MLLDPHTILQCGEIFGISGEVYHHGVYHHGYLNMWGFFSSLYTPVAKPSIKS